jgi:hypothetical protein
MTRRNYRKNLSPAQKESTKELGRFQKARLRAERKEAAVETGASESLFARVRNAQTDSQFLLPLIYSQTE